MTTQELTSVFQSMVNNIPHQYPRVNTPVNLADYQQWCQESVFDALRGLRYGQSFCNYFGIQDNILFYSQSVNEADKYILENYVE
jgi:hypothetical protein